MSLSKLMVSDSTFYIAEIEYYNLGKLLKVMP